MITMVVTFFAAVQCAHARRGAVSAGVMVASKGMAAASSGSGRPARAEIRSGVESDQPRVSSVAGVKQRRPVVIAASASRCGTRRLLANARRVRNEPIVSRPISRAGTGRRRSGSDGAVMASPGGGLAAGAGGFGGVVQADAVQGVPGDLLRAVQDGVHGRAADEVGQAA